MPPTKLRYWNKGQIDISSLGEKRLEQGRGRAEKKKNQIEVTKDSYNDKNSRQKEVLKINRSKVI